MKIVLTRVELADVLRKHYPAPENQLVVDVEIQKHSVDFCTICFAERDKEVPVDEASVRT